MFSSQNSYPLAQPSEASLRICGFTQLYESSLMPSSFRGQPEPKCTFWYSGVLPLSLKSPFPDTQGNVSYVAKSQALPTCTFMLFSKTHPVWFMNFIL